jgi:succinoglycan biosynthesis protein ExoM
MIGALEAETTVDICVCTFQRTFLTKTLKSIANVKAVGLSVRVIVVDNDFVASAAPLVKQIAGGFPFPIAYVHAPAGNISIARNACLDEATAEFVAFVDDDETVTQDWLDHLMRTAVANNAGVVLGPVQAEYDESAPTWMRRGDFHSTAPVIIDGDIVTGYTCNVLIRWSGAVKGQRFHLALGRSGGEDTDFFYRLHDLGVRFVEAPRAIVQEPVPASRATLAWLIRRRFRSGQTYGARLLAERRPMPGAVALAGAKIGYCLVATATTALSPVRWRRNLLRAVLHAGTVAGLLRSPQPEFYGGAPNEPAQTTAPLN